MQRKHDRYVATALLKWSLKLNKLGKRNKLIFCFGKTAAPKSQFARHVPALLEIPGGFHKPSLKSQINYSCWMRYVSMYYLS